MNVNTEGQRYRRQRQDGVVLLVVLMLLLLTTIVGYQVMETSSLEARMAVARQGKEVSFQAAESIIDQSKNDQNLLVLAFIAGLNNSAWPESTAFTFVDDAALAGRAEVRYVDEVATLGNDLVIGNPGLRSLHFEIRAQSGRVDDRFNSQHIQGIKRFAPKLL
ncbi:PilX N-terminal domain-containing pilus assembly protein [Congregibacter brevis]|uniref:PilX N-terminal domain-containing pilus assembly protein n=1 Tax=Congregibacter brevis TaxID=3081201 RepID=A0ABZ0IAE4_9GAMM|nr:PilX N-terminal domain-containing pilus assembly protein [Congregibacter sp. IMCC45268]